MARRKYFTLAENAPPPLQATATRRVRFEEVDAIGMVWHGRYPSYFEDGRLAFGDKYGLTYAAFVKHQVMAPVAQMHFDFRAPLRFDEQVTIEAQLNWSDAMRFDFSYIIRNSNKTISASGYTVQVLTELDGSIIYAPPPWIAEFREKWRSDFWKR